MKNNFPQFKSGDTINVYLNILDDNKKKIQQFQGIVIKKKNVNSHNETFTIRKISYGIGVERIFPLFSPIINKIELKKKGFTRRSKLYFLRNKYGKFFKIKEDK